MKALILNSGTGSRMGALTAAQPKCMTPLTGEETILSRQLRLLAEAGVRQAVITTGKYDAEIRRYCAELAEAPALTFVPNPHYAETNYIVSMDLAADALAGEELLLLHGDLVFEPSVLRELLAAEGSRVAVSASRPLPEKDFKAVLRDGRVEKIGIEFFENAVASQPLYRLTAADWDLWRAEIRAFCLEGQRTCYAENALNRVSGGMNLRPLDVGSDAAIMA